MAIPFARRDDVSEDGRARCAIVADSDGKLPEEFFPDVTQNAMLAYTTGGSEPVVPSGRLAVWQRVLDSSVRPIRTERNFWDGYKWNPF